MDSDESFILWHNFKYFAPAMPSTIIIVGGSLNKYNYLKHMADLSTDQWCRVKFDFFHILAHAHFIMILSAEYIYSDIVYYWFD